MASGTYYPAAGADDGYWMTGGSLWASRDYCSFGDFYGDFSSFFRFANVTIPPGSIITSAFIRLTAQEAQSGIPCNVNIYFNNEDDATNPTSSAEAAGKAVTAKIDWDDIPAFTEGVSYDTPELNTILQTVVDRGGFSSGNHILVFIKEEGETGSPVWRKVSSIEYLSGAEKAELHVAWVTGTEITLPNPFLAMASLQSNIQIEIVPGALQAETSMSIGEPFWGTFIELPSPFAAQSSLQAKTGLEIAITPLIVQTNLQSNIQIELVPPAFAVQSEMFVGEIFRGYQIELPEAFSANASLQANTQIELVTAPLLATGTLFSNLGIEVSAGALNVTGAILATPVYPIILTGAKRIYLFTLTGTADGVEDIVIPISSFQSRIKSGDPTYLSVVIPGIDYASAINARLNGDLVIRMGYQDGDEILLTEIVSRVLFENVTIDEGAVNKSITLDGHRIETWTPKTVSLENASYYNLAKGKLRHRCKPDLYLRPGDIANINDDSFTVESITYSVSSMLETYEVAE